VKPMHSSRNPGPEKRPPVRLPVAALKRRVLRTGDMESCARRRIAAEESSILADVGADARGYSLTPASTASRQVSIHPRVFQVR
jgi:hypothetical protein